MLKSEYIKKMNHNNKHSVDDDGLSIKLPHFNNN